MFKHLLKTVNIKLQNTLISTKIQLMASIFLLCCFVLMLLYILTLINSTQSEIQKKIENSEKSVDKAIQFYKKNLITTATLIAENNEIKTNLMNNEKKLPKNKLIEVLGFLQEKSPVQYSWIYNNKGQVVASGHAPFNTVALYDIDNTLYQHAIEGESVYTIDSQSPMNMILKIAVPIYEEYNKLKIIGACVLGIKLDTSFASIIRDISGVEVIFLDNYRLIATSFGLPKTASQETPVFKNLETRTINGIDYDIQFTQIWSFESTKNFLIAIAIDNSQIKQEIRKVLRQMIFFFFLFFTIVYFFSVKIKHSIIAPINQVIRGVKKISTKDFNYRIRVDSNDEIGLLAETFNYMSKEIQSYALALQESEKNLSTTLDSIGDGVIVTNKNLGILRMNPVAEELCTKLPDKKQNNNLNDIFKLINSKSGAPIHNFLQPVIDEGKTVHLTSDTLLVSQNLETHYVSISAAPIRKEDQTLFGAVIVFRDITETYHTREELKESQKRYQMLFETMFNGFALHEMIYDKNQKPIDYRFLEVNPAYEKLTGIKKEDIIGKTVLEVLHEVEKDWLVIYDEVASTGKSRQLEYYSDAYDRYYDVFAFSHKKGMFATLFNDVTERKKREYEIRKFSEEMETRVKERTLKLKESLEIIQNTQTQLVQTEKMAALGNLVAGVAHEINTPIGIGVTAASYLEQKTMHILEAYQQGNLNSDKLKNYLQTASKSSSMIFSNLTRAAELIHNFKQVAVDQTSEQKRVFLLKEYMDSILLSLHPQLKKTKHVIKINCPDDLAINSYPGVFSQIITNFIVNSLIHGFENKEKGQITLDINLKNHILIIKYTDDGCGIPQASLPKIFDPFFTTKRGQGGSGLGLHIVYNLVTSRLGGTIECQSIPGQGTSFTLELPQQTEKKHGHHV